MDANRFVSLAPIAIVRIIALYVASLCRNKPIVSNQFESIFEIGMIKKLRTSYFGYIYIYSQTRL